MSNLPALFAQLDSLNAECMLFRHIWSSETPWSCKITIQDHNNVKAEVEKRAPDAEAALQLAWDAIAHVAAKGLNLRQLAAPAVYSTLAEGIAEASK